MPSVEHSVTLVPSSAPTPAHTLLTSLIQSDIMWVLGVRKWKLRTMTEMITTAVTRSMIKSRYLVGSMVLEYCHRDWAQGELASGTKGFHNVPTALSGAQDSLANEGDGVGSGRQALGDEQEEDRLGQEH